jgi:hypothetical protein
MKDPHGSAKFMTKRKEELLQGGRRARDTKDWASRDTCDRYTGIEREREGEGRRALGYKEGEGLPADWILLQALAWMDEWVCCEWDGWVSCD